MPGSRPKKAFEKKNFISFNCVIAQTWKGWQLYSNSAAYLIKKENNKFQFLGEFIERAVSCSFLKLW